MAMLTDARESLWDAIDNWPAVQALGLRQFRNEKKFGVVGMAPTGLGDLPAISILPSSVKPEWATNRAMSFEYVLDVRIYTNYLDEAEDAVEKIWQALYQCRPDGETASYVKLATGYNPKQLAISIEPVAIGKEGANLCLRTTLTVGLRPEQDPQGNT